MKGKTCAKIEDRSDAVYDDSSLLMATVKSWSWSHVVFSKPRPGGQKKPLQTKILKKKHGLVMTDHRLKLSQDT